MEHPWLRHYDPDTPYTLTYPDVTLDRFLDDAARDCPNRPAISFALKYLLGGRVLICSRLTYRRLRTHVDRFFAALRLGAIVVNTTPSYTAPESQHQMADSGAETIVLRNLFLPRLRKVQADLPQLKRVVVAMIDDTLPFPASALVRQAQRREPDWVEVIPDESTFRFADLLTRSSAVPPAIPCDPSDVALFQYTGGTTGVPKAAMLTHRNLVSNALQAQSWLPRSPRGTERMMCAIPFFHVYG